MKTLFIVTAVIESGTGLLFLVSPSVLGLILLGSSIDGAMSLVLSRVAGLLLLSLGVACWLAHKDEESRAAKGLVGAMLLYNSGVAILLAYAAIADNLAGAGLWPTVILHSVMALWCIKHILRKQVKKTASLQEI